SLKNFFIYVLLSVGCMAALLPLLWMLVIACKQQGQALRFDFLPSSSKATAPYQVVVGTRRTAVILEYRNTSAQSVFVKAGFNQEREAEMIGEAGLFRISFFNVPPGEYDYGFIVDGEWVGDPQQTRRRSDGAPLLRVEGLLSSNIAPTNA